MKKVPESKFYFRGSWYSFDKVKKLACEVVGVNHVDLEDEEDLEALVEKIVKGSPSVSAKFIVTLSEGKDR